MSKETPYGSLFQEYLRVCNEALQHNKDCFPYNRIIHQIEELLKDHAVQAAIYDHDETHPEALYDMILKDGQLAAKAPHRPHSKKPWRLGKYFLEQVAKNPHTYIHNPAQLNWKWLTNHDVGL